MSKHTPGPLTVSHYVPHVDMRNEYALLDDRGDAIATLWGGDDRALANANLFAAAPELLEALKDCVQWLTAFAKGTGNEIIRETDRYQRYIAAIARAEGGQS